MRCIKAAHFPFSCHIYLFRLFSYSEDEAYLSDPVHYMLRAGYAACKQRFSLSAMHIYLFRLFRSLNVEGFLANSVLYMLSCCVFTYECSYIT